MEETIHDPRSASESWGGRAEEPVVAERTEDGTRAKVIEAE